VLEVTYARHLGDYTVLLRFNDGIEGPVDLKDALWGPVFEPLKQVEFFGKLTLSESLGTITWPNEADFAPEFLKDKLIEQRDSHAEKQRGGVK